MEKETDIFGGVTPFNEEVKEPIEVVDVPVYEQPTQQMEMVNEPVVPVEQPTVEPVPVEQPTVEQSYGPVPTEEFNGIAQPIVEDKEEISNSNLNPIEQKQDENAGLKFLLVLGLIFAITIILLPYFL